MEDVIELFMDCVVDVLFGVGMVSLLLWWLSVVTGG